MKHPSPYVSYPAWGRLLDDWLDWLLILAAIYILWGLTAVAWVSLIAGCLGTIGKVIALRRS